MTNTLVRRLVRVLLLPLLLLAGLGLPSLAQDTALTPDSSGASPVPTEALIEALENPDTRARLIDALRNAPDGSEGEAGGSDGMPAEQTLAAEAVEYSQSVISDVFESAVRALSDFERLSLLPELLTEERRQTILAELWPLLVTILVTTAVYRVLRVVSRRLRLALYDREAQLAARTRSFFVQVFARIVSVMVAWMAGNLMAAFMYRGAELPNSQSLFLYAFLIFGLLSAGLALFVSPDPRDVTFARLPVAIESTIHRSVRWVFAFLIYGLVLVVPTAQAWVNFVLARSLRTIVVTLGALAALYAVRRIRLAIAAHREAAREEIRAEGEVGEGLPDQSPSLWQRVWPPLTVIYILVSYAIALANPNQMVELVGRATLFTAIALGLFLIAMRLLAHMRDAPKIHLSQGINELLPPLEARLSGFMPSIVVATAVALIAVAALLFIEGWQLLDIGGWISGSGAALLWRIASIVIIVLGLILGWSVLTAWIDTRLSDELPGHQVSARSRTLLALFKNVITIALVVFGGMTALSELGIDIAPLLAGAGVIGLAIGFGAQKLVQDIITGVFIQLENAINEGDVVTVAGVTGAVEKLTIRSVGLRDLSGVYHLIPFSAVDTVSNFMRRFAFHVEVVGVAYDSDLDTAKEAMHSAFDKLKAGELGENILAPLEWHGVVSMGDSAVNLRARIKTMPGTQWATGRAYTELVKRELDAAGVEIPFPHRELKLPREFMDSLRPAQKAE